MKRFLIFDIDNTIATFDHEAGMASLQEHMRERKDIFDEGRARRICAFMNRCYHAFHAMAKGVDSGDLKKLESLIKDATQEVECLENFTDVHWSRELWIYLAAHGSLSPATAVEAAGHFWQGVQYAATNYDDAKKFFAWLNKRPDGLNYTLSPQNRWKTIFVTSSDARLKENHDNTKLLYNPRHSYRQKLIRVKRIIPNPPFGSAVFVGDPISKPHSEFWQKVFANIGYNPEEDLAIMTGDSPRSDLTGLDRFGIIPVLIDREGKFTPSEVPHAKYIIKSLEELKNIMEIEYLNKKKEIERRK